MQTLERLSPEATRRDEVEGVPVMLADGQTWHLATPTARIRPRFEPDPEGPEGSTRVGLDVLWDYPRPARARVQRLIDSASSEAPTFPMSVVVEAALSLLMLCHDVAAADALPLFELTMGEAEDLAVGLLRLFRGDRPTPTPDDPEDESKES